ncbi:MAG: L-histidine N(alpha)-methyltransferase [Thermoleophilia bacterium]
MEISSQPIIAARHPFVEDWRPDVVPVESVAHPQAASELALMSGDGDTSTGFALAVARGLSDIPRRLDSRFLYDAYGSFIFERICEQPEYYLTRTEATILASAAADIAGRTGELTLVELGSGSSVKTRLLLEAYAGRHGSACYTPVDISKSILEQAEQEIAALYPEVRVEAMHGTYDDAFPLLPSLSPAMLLFLGSTVGNLDAHEASQFWGKITSHLLPGDYCLLGVDINEDAASLNAAYNDAAGFSAAFTRNMFARMNRELGASLDVTAIDHVARYAPKWRRVEIFARFRREQRIEIAPAGSAFRIGKGELILTEVSRKFHLRQLVPYLCTFGLNTEQIYSDRNQRFAVLLLRKA